MIQDAGDQTITERQTTVRAHTRHADQWEELQYLLLPLVVTSGHQLHPSHCSPVGQERFWAHFICVRTNMVLDI